MPLQQLVEYFNDRLELENKNGFRPFMLEGGLAYGLFGPIRVGTTLSTIRESLRTCELVGYNAQLSVSARDVSPLQTRELENLMQYPSQNDSACDSVIHFDRLSRTVHMLNYLPYSHLAGLLILDVDPRHILGVKKDHGAYFEEIIVRCGLKTSDVVIGLTINSVYSRFYASLLKGLENYQRRGYRLALKLEPQVLDKSSHDLVTRAGADFVGLSSEKIELTRDSQILAKVQQLIQQTMSIGGRSILFNIVDKRQAELAQQLGFDLVEGKFFEEPVTSVDVQAETYQRRSSRFAAIAI